MTDLKPAAAELGMQVVRLTRQMGALKAHATSKHRHGVEWSSYVLLFHLVEHGLVERRPDPDDRRAIQLVATESGHALFARMRDERDELIAGVLQDWQPEDVRNLASLLDRFTTDLERHRPRLLKQLESQEIA